MLDDRQYRSVQVCPADGHGGSNSVLRAACADLRNPGRTMLGAEQEAWLAAGLAASPARWNILAQQTLMAQMSQLPLVRADDGRFWTDGWDGYPMVRRRLLDTLTKSRAANPLVLGGDVHSFFATELRADFGQPASARNPLVATEFCGTSVTSSSRPQSRTAQLQAMNPHIRFGRSDKRGFMLLEVTPSKTTTHFMALDDVRDPRSAASTLATFNVENGRAGLILA